jgi:hypothetical protein
MPPLRVFLYEDDTGRAIFEYDKLASFFGQFGDGPGDNETLEEVLLRAGG